MRFNGWIISLVAVLAGIVALMVPVQSVVAASHATSGVAFSAVVFNPSDYTMYRL